MWCLAVGRHVVGMSTLCRGQEIRAMKPSYMSHVSYPLRPSTLQTSQHVPASPEELAWGEDGRQHNMECVAFTNIMGKGNPGDRTDVDVGDNIMLVTTALLRCCCLQRCCL